MILRKLFSPQTITTNIRKISQNVNSMQQTIMQLQYAPSFDNESVRQQLHQIQYYTQQLAKDTNKSLKDMSLGSKNKVLKERLANDFADALKAFQTFQRKEAEQERAEVKRALAASQRGNLIELEGQLPPPPSGRQQPLGGYQQQALMIEEESNLEVLREREEAVKDLEQNIIDMNLIFKDMALMVHESAVTLDSIEAHVENATIRVQKGAEQLSKVSSVFVPCLLKHDLL